MKLKIISRINIILFLSFLISLVGVQNTKATLGYKTIYNRPISCTSENFGRCLDYNCDGNKCLNYIVKYNWWTVPAATMPQLDFPFKDWLNNSANGGYDFNGCQMLIGLYGANGQLVANTQSRAKLTDVWAKSSQLTGSSDKNIGTVLLSDYGVKQTDAFNKLVQEQKQSDEYIKNAKAQGCDTIPTDLGPVKPATGSICNANSVAVICPVADTGKPSTPTLLKLDIPLPPDTVPPNSASNHVINSACGGAGAGSKGMSVNGAHAKCP